MTSKEAISATDPLILEAIRSVMTPTPEAYQSAFAGFSKEKTIAVRCNNFKDWIGDRSIFAALRKAVDAYDAAVQHLAFMKAKGLDYMTMESSYPDPRFLHIASEQDGFPEMDIGGPFETKKEEEEAINRIVYKYALGYEEMMKKDIKNYVSFLTEKANSALITTWKFIADPETVEDVDDTVARERIARSGDSFGKKGPVVKSFSQPIPPEQRVYEARDAMGAVVPV